MRILMDTGRLAEAVHLALDSLHVWDHQVPVETPLPPPTPLNPTPPACAPHVLTNR